MLPPHQRENEAKLGQDVERKPAAAAERAGDRECLPFIAPAAFDQHDGRDEAAAGEHRGTRAEARPHGGMPGSELEKPFHPQLERVDDRGLAECRVDLYERRLHGRASLRQRRRPGAPGTLTVTILARPGRHRVCARFEKWRSTEVLDTVPPRDADNVSKIETIVKIVTELAGVRMRAGTRLAASGVLIRTWGMFSRARQRG